MAIGNATAGVSPRGVSRARTGVAIAVACATGVLVTQAVDLTTMADAGIRLVRTPLLLVAFLLAYSAAFYLRAVAWAVLAPGLGTRHSFAILHASLFVNHVAPVKLGEVVRPALASRRGISASDAVATSVIARLLDVMSLVVIVALMLPLGLVPLGAGAWLIALPFAALASAVAGLAWLRAGGRIAVGPAKLRELTRSFSDSLRGVPLAHLAGAAALTLPSWLLEGAVVLIAATALGADVPIALAVAVTAFTLMFQMLHVTPGGIGVYEASMSGALVSAGLPLPEAVAVAVLAHGLKFAYSFTVGLGCTVLELRSEGRDLGVYRAGHLAVLAVVGLQAVLVSGYFAGDWSATWVLGIDSLLLLSAIAMVLGRQWAGAWRPLPRTAAAQMNDRRPIVAVIPAYNEAEVIATTIAQIPRDVVGHVIVVDDGSSDGTARAALAAGADEVVHHASNRGLGAALRSALDAAKAHSPRAVVYVDADSEYDPSEASQLLAPVLSGDADYVLGSRNLGTRSGQLPSRRWGNALFTGLLCFVAGRRITDGQTGFRAFSPRALATAEIIHDYNYAQVLTLDLLRKRMRLREVPITWRRRCVGTSFVRSEYLWRVPLGMLRELVNP